MKHHLFVWVCAGLGCTLSLHAAPNDTHPKATLEEHFEQELTSDWSVGSKWNHRSDDGIDNSGCYVVQEANSSSVLVTPIITVNKSGYRLAYSQKGNSAFSYDDWTIYDEFYIDYAVDGGDFVELKKLPDSFSKYTSDTLDLPVDSGSRVQIRFRYEHLETPWGYEANGKRFIDDVEIGTLIAEPQEPVGPEPITPTTRIDEQFENQDSLYSWIFESGWEWNEHDGVSGSSCVAIKGDGETAMLILPTIDLTEGKKYMLHFSHKGTNGADASGWALLDEFYLASSVNGAPFSKLQEIKDASGFKSDSLNLSALAGDSLRLAFVYNFLQEPSGWDPYGSHYIDNVRVELIEEEEPVIPEPQPLPTEVVCSFDSIQHSNNWKLGDGWEWSSTEGHNASGCMVIKNEIKSATLTAPTVDISAGNYVLLFSHKGSCSLDLENWANNDEFYVEYSLDGADYVELKEIKDSESAFKKDSINLAHLEGDSISIRFHYVFNQTPSGWDTNGTHRIDNFSLAQMKEVVEPEEPKEKVEETFDEELDEESGWDVQAGWAFTEDQGVDNSGCMAIVQPYTSASMTTPIIKVESDQYTINFDQKGYSVTEGWNEYDRFIVEYALDGGEYIKLAQLKDATSFKNESFTISTEGASELQVRFRFEVLDQSYGPSQNWVLYGERYIDNIVIKAEMTVGMVQNKASKVSVSIIQKQVTLQSEQTVELAACYDMSGQLLYEVTTAKKEVSFTLPETGVYILRYIVDGNTFIEKIICR